MADGREQAVVEISLVQQTSAAWQRDVEGEGQSAVRRCHERSGQMLELVQVGSQRNV